MRSRWRAVLRACDLQDMLARFFLGHPELRYGRPVLDTGHRRTRREAMADGLASERHRYLDVAAAVQMYVDRGRFDDFNENDVVFQRRFAIFDIEERVDFATVLLK